MLFSVGGGIQGGLHVDGNGLPKLLSKIIPTVNLGGGGNVRLGKK